MTAEPPVRPQGQVARDAYKRALRTYKQSLSAKEYAKVTVPATLEGTCILRPLLLSCFGVTKFEICL